MPDTPLLFDLTDWSVIALTGADRQSYLHSFCTNDIKKLNTGDTCEAFIPNEKGRILGHVFVLNGTEELTLISTPQANQVLASHLTKYLLGVEAEITDKTSVFALMAVIGDNAAEAIGLSTELEPNRMQEVSIAGCQSIVSRQAMMLPPTYLIAVQQTSLDQVRNQIFENGAAQGTTEQFEQLRITAGFPIVGIDLSDANIVQESARVEATTSFKKGCYLGQEPIARLDAMGHTNKELRGFRIESAAVQPGTKILAEEKEVGEISSVVKVDEAQSLALGIIRIKHAQPGNNVAIVTYNGTYPAEIYWDHK